LIVGNKVPSAKVWLVLHPIEIGNAPAIHDQAFGFFS
jgi:hypothetical protein